MSTTFLDAAHVPGAAAGGQGFPAARRRRLCGRALTPAHVGGHAPSDLESRPRGRAAAPDGINRLAGLDLHGWHRAEGHRCQPGHRSGARVRGQHEHSSVCHRRRGRASSRRAPVQPLLACTDRRGVLGRRRGNPALAVGASLERTRAARAARATSPTRNGAACSPNARPAWAFDARSACFAAASSRCR